MSQSPVPFVSPGWDGNEELPFHLRGLRKLGIRVYCHCLDLLLEVSYLSILNSSGPASEDLVKDVISQIIFFFLLLARVLVVITSSSTQMMQTALRSVQSRSCCGLKPICKFGKGMKKISRENSRGLRACIISCKA